jgi:hypothetical protein
VEQEAVVVIEHLFQVLQVKKQLQFKVIQLPLVEVEQEAHLLLLLSQDVMEILQFFQLQHQQLVVEVEQQEPVKLVDQVEVVELALEPVEQEILPLKVHLPHPFKDMLAELEYLTLRVAAVVVAALRQ